MLVCLLQGYPWSSGFCWCYQRMAGKNFEPNCPWPRWFVYEDNYSFNSRLFWRLVEFVYQSQAYYLRIPDGAPFAILLQFSELAILPQEYLTTFRFLDIRSSISKSQVRVGQRGLVIGDNTKNTTDPPSYSFLFKKLVPELDIKTNRSMTSSL